MPSEMVERGARALYKRNPYYESGEAIDGFEVTPGGCLSWEQCCEGYPEYVQALQEDARAAIEAMRIPTAAMVEAGEAAAVDLSDDDPVSMRVWRAAIDAALSEEEGGDGD